MAGNDKVRKLVKQAKALGCTLEHRSNHIVVRTPDGRIATMVPRNVGYRAYENMRADLHRAGLDV